MRVLFAITAVCLLALIGAGLAIRRHILDAARARRNEEAPGTDLQAMEAELKRELHTTQTQKGFFGGAPENLADPRPGRSMPRFVKPASTIRPAYVPAPASPAPPVAHETAPEQSTDSDLRKPPASSQGDKTERPDWQHFNKDFGDLSDPYQPRRSVGNARSATNHRR